MATSVIFVHVERYTSNISRQIRLLQIGRVIQNICTYFVTFYQHFSGAVAVNKGDLSAVDGSFFRAVEPSRTLLNSYKFDGDLLQAFHMTESDGDFLFRKQFDMTAKRIVCKKEVNALKDFLRFLENYSRFYLISIEEEVIGRA